MNTTFDISLTPTDGLVSDGEFLDITEIKRQQAEDYECITNNGVASPDRRKIRVTVNCTCSSSRTGPPVLSSKDVHIIHVNTKDASL